MNSPLRYKSLHHLLIPALLAATWAPTWFPKTHAASPAEKTAPAKGLPELRVDLSLIHI